MIRTLFLGASALSATLPACAFAQDDLATDDVIIVTGSPLDRSRDELLTGASVLTGDELQRQVAGSLGETLRTEPGLSETGYAPGASRPIIRGLGGDRVRVLTNGVGTIDAASASPDHAVPVEPALAERVEVVRGTGLLRYGSSAAGGVVNVLDGRLPSTVPDDGVDGALRIGGETVNDGLEAAGGVTARAFEANGVSVLLSAAGSYREAADYDIPGFAESAQARALEEALEEQEEDEGVFGTLGNSFAEASSASGGVSLVGDRGFLAVSTQRNESTYGVPGGHGHGPHDVEQAVGEDEGGVFIELDQTRYDLNGRFELGGAFEALSVFAGVADYTHTEFEGAGEPGTVFANEGWELRAELLQAERGGWRGASGVQLRDREFSAIGEEAFVPPTTTDQMGLYTFQEVRSGPWHAEGALRFERTGHERSTDGATREFDGWSISAGAGYDIGDVLGLSGTLSRTERAPNTEELFSNGPHLATDAYEVGDESLGLETATGVELLAHLHGARGDLTLNLFRTAYDGFVYERETGRTAEELFESLGEVLDEEGAEEFGGLPVYAFTAADATFTGFEVFGAYDLGEAAGWRLGVDGVLDFVSAKLDEGGDLPRIPPLGLTAGIEATRGPVSLRAEAEHAADQDDTASFELPTDAYTLLNLAATWEVRPGLSLVVQGRNLTDEEARQHTSFLKEVVPLPGRSFRASLRYAY